MSSRLWMPLVYAVAIIVAGATYGDTVTFPSTSLDNVHCADDLVDHACGLVRFHGGHFTTDSGGTAYVGGQGFPSCVSGELTLGFVGMTASDVSISIRNFARKTDQSIRMETTDIVDGVITTTSTVQAFPGTDPDVSPAPPPPDPITLHTSGHAIVNVRFSIVNPAGVSNYEEAWWVLLSASITPSPIQPDTVPGPTVAVRIDRNSDGTSSAVVGYTFPAGNSSSRMLTVNLLPSSEAPGSALFSQSALDATGSVTIPLGSFDTDRTLRATAAAACSGYDSKEASVAASCSSCKAPPTQTGAPVRLFDGAMLYDEDDPRPKTVGSEWRRHYASSVTSDGAFGIGWSSIFDARIVTTNDALFSSVTVEKEDRSRTTFRGPANGSHWVQSWPAGGVPGTLTGNETSGYQYRDAGGALVRSFDVNHRLSRLYDRRTDRAVSLTYDTAGQATHMADEAGNWACTLVWMGGHIIQISVDGRPDLTWNYSYTTTGSLLASVSLAGTAAPWRSYEYTNGRLSAIRDALGASIESHDYDSLGRATSSYDASGDITNIEYGASDSSGRTVTRITRADASQATFTQGFAAGGVVTTQSDGGCSSCGASDATAAYDARGNLTRLQDARGYVTTYEYDGGGRVISEYTYERPSSCNPATDSARCRMTAEALAVATLVATSRTQHTATQFGTNSWPQQPTLIARSSIVSSGNDAVGSFAYEPTTGQALLTSMSGYTLALNPSFPPHVETHSTLSTLYNGTDTAAFNPGGAFDTSWLSLPQPLRYLKASDGPRTDVSDITQFVYYPVDPSVPATWRGRLASIRNSVGQIIRFEDYDVFGTALTTVDANGVRTTRTVDALGRLVSTTLHGVPGCDATTDPLCLADLTSTVSYAAVVGPPSTSTSATGGVVVYTYDNRGRMVSMSRGPASTDLRERIEYTYDPTTGRKSSERYLGYALGSWTETRRENHTYDPFGRLLQTTHSDGTAVVSTYDADGHVLTTRDERHASPNVSYTYDEAGQLVVVTQALADAPGSQVATSYTYDINGNLTTVTDANGWPTSYAFDDFGHTVRETDFRGVTIYGYDEAGNAAYRSHQNGTTSLRSYDALNRLLSTVSSSATAPTETVTYAYDGANAFGIGRLSSLTDPTGSTEYRYDRRGRTVRETKNVGSSSYTTRYGYDANGARTSITYPSGATVNYSVDYAGRQLTASRDGVSIVSSATYLPFGPVSSMTLGNGTTKTMSFDARYRPLENKLTGSAGVLADYTYVSDPAGNITQIHDALEPSYNRDFAYDDLNRLVTANTGSSLWGAGSYTYNLTGSMTQASLGTDVRRFYYGNQTFPWMTVSDAGGAYEVRAYDAEGNDTTGGATYSSRNYLASADGLSYGYDGRGVRTTTTYPAASLVSLTFTPATLYPGQSTIGRVTLGEPAPAGGAVVTLHHDPTRYLEIPASVTVPAGGTTAIFSVGPGEVGKLTVTAHYNTTATAVLTILDGPNLTSLTVNPEEVAGGSTATLTATLAAPAPPGGAPIDLTNSYGSFAAIVPNTLVVPEGLTSASVPIPTTPVTDYTGMTFVGFYNLATHPFGISTTLLIDPVVLTSVSISPSSVTGGFGNATGLATLETPAPDSGVTVTLASSAASAASVPPSVQIAAGATSAQFPITTYPVSVDTSATITGTVNNTSASASLAILRCVPASTTPTIPAGDSVWIEDSLPAGLPATSAWDTSQKASGTQSLHVSLQSGFHDLALEGATAPMPVQYGGTVVAYILVNQCNRPSTLRLTFGTSNGYRRAVWGTALGGENVSMGPVPTGTGWVRAEIPAAQLGAEGMQIYGIRFELVDGEAWFDHIGTGPGGCTPAPSAATVPTTDTVWIEDSLPAGLPSTSAWDTSQKASGTQSLHVSLHSGFHDLTLEGATSPMPVQYGGTVVAYVLVNQCAPPTTIRLTFATSNGYRRAYWGTALGAENVSMGAIPSGTSWIRAEIPAAQLGAEGTQIYGVHLELVDGEAWFDHIGTAPGGCTPANPTASVPSTDNVWIEDTLPSGFSPTTAWDTTRKASGTQSLRARLQTGFHRLQFEGATTQMHVNTGDHIITYLLVNECAPPSTIRILYGTMTNHHRTIYWGTAIGTETLAMGPIPAGGTWLRVDVPASQLQLEGEDVGALYLDLVDGEAWFDHVATAPAQSGAISTPAGTHEMAALGDDATPVSLGITAHPLSATDTVLKHTLYTPELSLLAETDEVADTAPAIAHEYLWFAGAPIAQVDVPSNTPHWVFTDHLGTPLLRTNAAGSIDWRAEYEPFGAVSSFRAGATDHQPLRFPGQEFDPKAGDLEYNVFRWYRAGWGRYTQADPMGLAAGTNLFGYAVSNPLGYIDPTGLEALPIPAQPPGEICPFPTLTPKAPNPSIGWKGGVIAVLIDFLLDPGIADAPTLERMQAKLKQQCGRCKEQPRCPPCNPPVGTLGYRWDKVPPSPPHPPWTGDHLAYYFQSQSPAPVCKCFWSNTGVVLPPPPSPIAVPLPNSPVWP